MRSPFIPPCEATSRDRLPRGEVRDYRLQIHTTVSASSAPLPTSRTAPIAQRNLVERFFNKLKQLRHIAIRYDKLGATFFAFLQLASIRIFLRSIESTA